MARKPRDRSGERGRPKVGIKLEAEPLLRAMRRFQADHNMDDREFNKFLGYTVKSGRWNAMQKQKTFTVPLADRILCLMDQPGRLNELWPHLAYTYDERELREYP